MIIESVPYQQNGFDCGVFVCRYIDALYQQRDQKICYKHLHCKRPLSELITNSIFFTFGMPEIALLRDEMGKLIDNLSAVYFDFKGEESKIAERARRTGNEMTSALIP